MQSAKKLVQGALEINLHERRYDSYSGTARTQKTPVLVLILLWFCVQKGERGGERERERVGVNLLEQGCQPNLKIRPKTFFFQSLQSSSSSEPACCFKRNLQNHAQTLTHIFPGAPWTFFLGLFVVVLPYPVISNAAYAPKRMEVATPHSPVVH